MGSISLGLALVAGRNRVPRPATGNTATSIRFFLLFFWVFFWAAMGAPAIWGPETYHAPIALPQPPGSDGAIVCGTSHRTRPSEPSYAAGLAGLAGAGLDGAAEALSGAAALSLPLSLPRRMSPRFLSMSFCEMPSTMASWSAVLKGPFFSR